MKQSRQENLIYLIVWSLLFAAPLLSLYVRTVSDSTVVFDWSEIWIVWRKIALYLALFLVHNFLLAPLLVHGHRRVAYFSIVTVIIAAFTVYQCNSRPEKTHNRPIPQASPPPPLLKERGDGMKPFPAPPLMEREMKRGRGDGRWRREKGLPPPIVGEHDIMAVVVLILMLGANLGIKGYFRSRNDRKRLAELEHENLEQQLEYLRYQINPHFFMNTLNNIHALVDIDPEKAKDTILELSKMMRFVLYEGNRQSVPLTKEMDFIRHYVALMQLRYTEKVKITLDLPSEMPDRQIPPLILITFIENAFKHGVSYQHESFIEVKTMINNNKLCFKCSNSKTDKPNEEKGGVGLKNVRKRLNLLYENNYTLNIQDGQDVYSVELSFPLKS